jgi:general secretion pathway protein G
MDDYAAGFTLVEMLVGLAITCVLAMVCVSGYSSYIEKYRETATIEEIHAIESSIQSYELLNGVLPQSLADIGADTRRDPWGNPYLYLRIEDSDDAKGHGYGKGKQRRDRNMNPVNTDYDLYSMGKDGETATQFTAKKARDDIVRANNGEYVGLASEH